MTIEIKINESLYGIAVDGNCFTAIKYGVNEAKESKNYGERTSKELGYFNKLSNACLRLCREEIAMSDDIVTLKQFSNRIEAINKQMTDQLEYLETNALVWLKEN